ncbi:hypothetical protein Aduo_008956 [Ancylostoma duodenale]
MLGKIGFEIKLKSYPSQFPFSRIRRGMLRRSNCDISDWIIHRYCERVILRKYFLGFIIVLFTSRRSLVKVNDRQRFPTVAYVKLMDPWTSHKHSQQYIVAVDVDELEGVLESLETLKELVEDEASMSGTRAYVCGEHAVFLETRLRIFDEYLVSRRLEGFLNFIRFVAEGGTFSSLALEYGCGKQTVSDVVKEVTEAIITGLYTDAFLLLNKERP